MEKIAPKTHSLQKLSVIIVIGLICAAHITTLCFSQQEERREITIRGSVTNEDGYPVRNIPVRFIMQKRGFNKNNAAIDILEENEISTRSDSRGLYEIIWLEDTSFNNYYLRFYREGDFDEVLYQKPVDTDITEQIKLSDVIKVDHLLKFNPKWDEIQAEIERLGPDSDMGRVLRQRGIPDKKEKFNRKQLKNVQIWWYYSQGVCYRFKGIKIDKVFRFNASDLEGKLNSKKG